MNYVCMCKSLKSLKTNRTQNDGLIPQSVCSSCIEWEEDAPLASNYIPRMGG